MTPRHVTTVRIDEELLEGMRNVEERDGVLVSEQVRRAIRAWLATKGFNVKPARKRAAETRKRA